jgi:hypothetical protein
MPIQFITPSIISSVANTQVTGTITASQIATVNANTITSGTIPLAQVPQLTGVKMPAGTILQVLQFASPGLSAAGTSYPNFAGRANLCTISITPKNSSSKIFLIYSGYYYPYDTSPSNNNQVGMNGVICRNGTPITGQNGWQFQANGASTYTFYGMQTFSILDSPGTASAISYTFDVYTWAGNNSTVQLRESSGYFVAMEVAQ